MKRHAAGSGFALIVTLVLLSFILIVVVSYLVTTRTDRSTSSLYANRLRAKMMADSGLAAASKLLYDNTKFGNYITAMPASVPPPPTIRTEIYRPVNPSPSPSPASADFLRLDNAVGEILASRVEPPASPPTPTPNPTPQVDPRPSPTPIPAPPSGGSFGLAEPGATPSVNDSFNFNQIVRVGNNDAGRLVDPDARAAFGQWIRVRNSAGELIGRYAFFIEDESMKVNVSAVANNLGPASAPNLRVNDLVPVFSPTPTPAPTPSSQIQEIDPTAVLSLTDVPVPSRSAAVTQLVTAGTQPSRLPTKGTLALLAQWQAHYPEFSHLLTAFSTDDNTTARGWQRLNLNTLVAGANNPPAKVAAVNLIANWIVDAWTNPVPIASLAVEHRIYGNQRLRSQLAANIVDYIDTDSIPTDLGDVLPDGYSDPAFSIPLIGIEKIPYLSAIFITFEASGRPPGGNTATMRMKMRFNFSNPFDTPLDLASAVTRIEVTGVPVVLKNVSTPVFDHYNQVYSIPITSLTPVQGSGLVVQPGTNGTSNSGARSFDTPWLVPGEQVTFVTTSGKPNFESGAVQIKVYGPTIDGSETRLDITSAATTDTPRTGYDRNASNDPIGDFLLDADTQARSVSAIYLQERIVDTSVTQLFGDPRYRPTILNDRWRRLNLNDNRALSDRLDLVDTNPRLYGSDWYDRLDDRPLVFFRNGPMLSIGELGNIATSEYPWRTFYLQQPERPSNGGGTTTVSDVTTRRTTSLDYALIDLFRADNSVTRFGGFNINSQQRFGSSTKALAALFLGIPVDAQTLADPAVAFISNSTGSASISTVSERRVASGPPADNNPRRPFFQIGELAPVLGRLVSTSANSTTGSPSRSTTIFSVLRNTPADRTEVNANYQRDMQVETPFRKVSSSITTRGNVFRVLFVGQTIKDINRDGKVQTFTDDPSYRGPNECVAEYLGEAFVQRAAVFGTPAPVGNSEVLKTVDSKFKIIAQRTITE